MTEELLNLSQKKCDAWLRLRDEGPTFNAPLFSKSISASANLPRWLPKRPGMLGGVSVQLKRAWFAEQLGQGGFLVKELRLLGRQVSKPAVTPLLIKDIEPITDDKEKLKRWAKHFIEVVNCEFTVSKEDLNALRVVPRGERSDSVSVSDSDLCAPITEDEVTIGISQLKNGRAPGVDDISAKFLKLSGDNCASG